MHHCFWMNILLTHLYLVGRSRAGRGNSSCSKDGQVLKKNFFSRIYNEPFKPVWHQPWVNTTIPCSHSCMNTLSEPSMVSASGKWSSEWAAEGWERNTPLLPPVALPLARQEDDNRQECPWHGHLFPQEESVSLWGETAVSRRSGIRWQQNFNQRECQGRLRGQEKLANGFLRTFFSLYEEAWLTLGKPLPLHPGVMVLIWATCILCGTLRPL